MKRQLTRAGLPVASQALQQVTKTPVRYTSSSRVNPYQIDHDLFKKWIQQQPKVTQQSLHPIFSEYNKHLEQFMQYPDIYQKYLQTITQLMQKLMNDPEISNLIQALPNFQQWLSGQPQLVQESLNQLINEYNQNLEKFIQYPSDHSKNQLFKIAQLMQQLINDPEISTHIQALPNFQQWLSKQPQLVQESLNQLINEYNQKLEKFIQHPDIYQDSFQKTAQLMQQFINDPEISTSILALTNFQQWLQQQTQPVQESLNPLINQHNQNLEGFIQHPSDYAKEQLSKTAQLMQQLINDPEISTSIQTLPSFQQWLAMQPQLIQESLNPLINQYNQNLEKFIQYPSDYAKEQFSNTAQFMQQLINDPEHASAIKNIITSTNDFTNWLKQQTTPNQKLLEYLTDETNKHWNEFLQSPVDYKLEQLEQSVNLLEQLKSDSDLNQQLINTLTMIESFETWLTKQNPNIQTILNNLSQELKDTFKKYTLDPSNENTKDLNNLENFIATLPNKQSIVDQINTLPGARHDFETFIKNNHLELNEVSIAIAKKYKDLLSSNKPTFFDIEQQLELQKLCISLMNNNTFQFIVSTEKQFTSWLTSQPTSIQNQLVTLTNEFKDQYKKLVKYLSPLFVKNLNQATKLMKLCITDPIMQDILANTATFFSWLPTQSAKIQEAVQPIKEEYENNWNDYLKHEWEHALNKVKDMQDLIKTLFTNSSYTNQITTTKELEVQYMTKQTTLFNTWLSSQPPNVKKFFTPLLKELQSNRDNSKFNEFISNNNISHECMHTNLYQKMHNLINEIKKTSPELQKILTPMTTAYKKMLNTANELYYSHYNLKNIFKTYSFMDSLINDPKLLKIFTSYDKTVSELKYLISQQPQSLQSILQPIPESSESDMKDLLEKQYFFRQDSIIKNHNLMRSFIDEPRKLQTLNIIHNTAESFKKWIAMQDKDHQDLFTPLMNNYTKEATNLNDLENLEELTDLMQSIMLNQNKLKSLQPIIATEKIINNLTQKKLDPKTKDAIKVYQSNLSEYHKSGSLYTLETLKKESILIQTLLQIPDFSQLYKHYTSIKEPSRYTAKEITTIHQAVDSPEATAMMHFAHVHQTGIPVPPVCSHNTLSLGDGTLAYRNDQLIAFGKLWHNLPPSKQLHTIYHEYRHQIQGESNILESSITPEQAAKFYPKAVLQAASKQSDVMYFPQVIRRWQIYEQDADHFATSHITCPTCLKIIQAEKQSPTDKGYFGPDDVQNFVELAKRNPTCPAHSMSQDDQHNDTLHQLKQTLEEYQNLHNLDKEHKDLKKVIKKISNLDKRSGSLLEHIPSFTKGLFASIYHFDYMQYEIAHKLIQQLKGQGANKLPEQTPTDIKLLPPTSYDTILTPEIIQKLTQHELAYIDQAIAYNIQNQRTAKLITGKTPADIKLLPPTSYDTILTPEIIQKLTQHELAHIAQKIIDNINAQIKTIVSIPIEATTSRPKHLTRNEIKYLAHLSHNEQQRRKKSKSQQKAKSRPNTISPHKEKERDDDQRYYYNELMAAPLLMEAIRQYNEYLEKDKKTKRTQRSTTQYI